MTLTLKDKETDRLAREVAALTGETLTQAVRTALAERRERLRGGPDQQHAGDKNPRLVEQLLALGDACAALPDVDPRPLDDIAGYDEQGLWR